MDPEVIANVPMSISDATSMLRRKINSYDREYVKITTKLNNRMIDEWEDKVLRNIADPNGKVPSGRVWGSWQLFLEGKEITKYNELRESGVIAEIPDEVFNFWKEFFETKSPEEMHAYGTGSVSYGFGVLQEYIKRWFVDQKWEKLYSQFPDDPLAWEKNYHKHSDVIFGKTLPFWTNDQLKDIQYKVSSVLSNTVTPAGASGYK